MSETLTPEGHVDDVGCWCGPTVHPVSGLGHTLTGTGPVDRPGGMGPYFRARWYVDQNGLLQRRTPADQQRMEDLLIADGAAPEDVFPDAAHWSANAEASR